MIAELIVIMLGIAVAGIGTNRLLVILEKVAIILWMKKGKKNE